MTTSLSLLLRRLVGLGWGLAICPVSVILLVGCVTWRGTVFALAAFLLGIAPALSQILPGNEKFRRASWMSLGAWLLLSLGLVFCSPSGQSREGAVVQNRYSDGGWHYRRFALGCLLPEVDQFMLGLHLVSAVDPFFTRPQARTVRLMTRAIYADLEANPDFQALGSAMPEAYDQAWGQSFEHGHYFLYVPPDLDRTKSAAALVFLHGTGGNFKAYTWLLARVARERGMVLISPSFGLGQWDAERGIQAVTSALENTEKIVHLDRDQIHLVGLSNGGLGVSRTAGSPAGAKFRSLIFLSPVCDKAAVTSSRFASQWRDKHVLVITGDQDDRVRLPYVERCATLMRESGAQVEMSVYEGADHFLFFSHRDRMLTEISAWLKEHSSPLH